MKSISWSAWSEIHEEADPPVKTEVEGEQYK